MTPPWPEPRTAKTHLGTIEYRDIGEGPAIVFLHVARRQRQRWRHLQVVAVHHPERLGRAVLTNCDMSITARALHRLIRPP